MIFDILVWVGEAQAHAHTCTLDFPLPATPSPSMMTPGFVPPWDICLPRVSLWVLSLLQSGVGSNVLLFQVRHFGFNLEAEAQLP